MRMSNQEFKNLISGQVFEVIFRKVPKKDQEVGDLRHYQKAQIWHSELWNSEVERNSNLVKVWIASEGVYRTLNLDTVIFLKVGNKTYDIRKKVKIQELPFYHNVASVLGASKAAVELWKVVHRLPYNYQAKTADRAFSWRLSPQGFSFWNDVSNRSRSVV